MKSKPIVRFTSLIPGLEKLMPIINAKDYKHAWVGRAHDEFAELRKDPANLMQRFVHTTRCPAIFSLQRNGWILRTWQDITIETFGDRTSFQWTSAIDQRSIHPNYKAEAVSSHGEVQYFKYQENFPSNTLRTVLKLNTPWLCAVPKGYYLLEMPVAYLDENRFTTMPGFYSMEHGPATLNVQVLWHVLNGKELIKAGTPIAQYILVKKDDVTSIVDSIGELPDHELASLSKNHRFMTNYGALKSLFSK